jgi:hypothetical protein
MKNFLYLWQYIAELFSKWELFETHVVKKIKTQLTFNKFFPRKSCCLWDNVRKYDRTGQDTDDSVIWRVRFAHWMNKATDTNL